jgi:hypothetical protein
LRKIFVCHFLLFIYQIGFCQIDFSIIDKEVKLSHKGETKIDRLTNKLTSRYQNSVDKIRAIFIWITNNIDYDFKQSRYNQLSETVDIIANRTLKNRKGVCMHYAMLFDTMAKAAGIESYYITGYGRESNGALTKESHAWNAIKISGRYYILDVTWASGFMSDSGYQKKLEEKYFMMPPDQAIKSHMPFDPIFQFLERPIKHEDFISNTWSIEDRLLFPQINFQDSLSTHFVRSKLDQATTSLSRIEAISTNFQLVEKHIDFLRDEINYEKYNLSMDEANKAINSINAVITYFNNNVSISEGARPTIEYELEYADLCISKSDQILSTIISSNETIINLTIKQRNQIGDLRNNLNEKIAFYKKKTRN